MATQDVDFFGNRMSGGTPSNEAEQFRQRYRRIKVVGKGSFGEAVLVRSRDDGKRYIAKTIDCANMSEKDKQDVYREIKILADVNHPNIVKYKEHYEEGNMLWIVMEYADGGDLGMRIKDQRKKATENGPVYFDETLIMMWFLQICMALKHLHDNHILHRDLKTANIFLTSKNVVKLGDFGISTVLNNTMAVAYTVCGTPYYFSPEICQNQPYGSKSDVWALGIVLYEMATLRKPFNAKGLKELMKKIVTGAVDPIPSHYNPQLSQLISKLLHVQHVMRPSVNKILESPYVQDSLRDFSRELATQTERDKQVYEEKKKRRPVHRQVVSQAPPSHSAPEPAEDNKVTFQKLKEMDRNALKAALANHKPTAEAEMAKREANEKVSNMNVGPGPVVDNDSDGDNGHISNKETMRGNIKYIMDNRGKMKDEEFGARDPGAEVKLRMPTGDMVDKRDARRWLEKKLGPDLVRQATSFLNNKLSTDAQAAVGDAQVQYELCKILGDRKAYANIISKLVLYEAST
ncbi:putative serine/threonine-protein kinase A [Diplonema papillatum]|nr:putative serine/threonine-protein kinase A [Diplonema papillatum]